MEEISQSAGISWGTFGYYHITFYPINLKHFNWYDIKADFIFFQIEFKKLLNNENSLNYYQFNGLFSTFQVNADIDWVTFVYYHITFDPINLKHFNWYNIEADIICFKIEFEKLLNNEHSLNYYQFNGLLSTF